MADREPFWVVVTVPQSQIHRAGYLAAAEARRRAGKGNKLWRITSGGTFNTDGTYEHRVRYHYAKEA